MICLYSRTPFPTEGSFFLFRRDPALPSFERFSSWTERCEATNWFVYLGSLPDKRVVSTHWILSPKSVIGQGWMKRRLARAKIIAVLLETLMVILHSLNHRWRSLIYDSRSWRAASACGTWLWWPCRPRTGPTRRGARVRACGWQTKEDRGDQSTLNHTSPHAATRWRGGLEGHNELLTLEV